MTGEDIIDQLTDLQMNLIQDKRAKLTVSFGFLDFEFKKDAAMSIIRIILVSGSNSD